MEERRCGPRRYEDRIRSLDRKQISTCMVLSYDQKRAESVGLIERSSSDLSMPLASVSVQATGSLNVYG
ncbi:hypothetical protein E2C01_067723 [Portunus trituberculatus]|uniref:Uncharacterized protein n=1 Tax=Portunus trituberculatus TaxID=210409 RepID=A0A5B7HUJ5_PORTR|nr:hypothetical protein [Portunus trituberculatus]